MKETQITHYELFADYYQFYLQDETVDGDLSDSWDEKAMERKLAIAPGTIGVGTARNNDVSVSIEILSAEPSTDDEAWDLVTEASLELSSGRLVIAGCTDDFDEAERLDLPADTYRVRVSYGALDSVSKDGLEGDDHYRVQLWPATKAEVRVLKGRARP